MGDARNEETCSGRSQPVDQVATTNDMDDEDTFTSVQWNNREPDDGAPPPSRAEDDAPRPPLAPRASTSRTASGRPGSVDLRPEGYLTVRIPSSGSLSPQLRSHRAQLHVSEPNKELDGTKDAYVSYAVIGKVRLTALLWQQCSSDRAQTSLPMYQTKSFANRRRFQDFTFLREHLTKDFPACVVPPLPEKHRMGAFAHRFSSAS